MVTLVLACHLTAGAMFLCKLPAQHRVYRVVVDTGSNVTSFVEAQPLRVTLSNGKQMKITPINEIPSVTLYNARASRGQRIDGIIGQDVLSRFRSLTVDYHRETITLVK